ncbi:MAG: hypothetical protein OEM41_07535 [Ignavibacteria bacterium]|nr:hypothetical protein [Ignavibacteria bacterium]
MVRKQSPSLRPHVLILSLLPLVSAVQASAQMAFRFSGYVANLPIYEHINEQFARFLGFEQSQVLNLTRLRLRPTLELWDGGKLAIEHEVNLLYQSTTQPSLQSTVVARRQLGDLRWESVTGAHGSLAHFIDRLYFRQNFLTSSLTIGRQRIQWGTGRVWNPTDVFNPINPANVDKIEKDGADAVSYTYYFGSFTDLELVWNPENGFRQWNAGARFRTNYAEYDMSVIGGYFDKRGMIGGDFAGNLATAGVRGEGVYWFERKGVGDAFLRCILGIDYQFTGTLYGLLEYQYNDEGSTDKNAYDLLRLLRGEILNVAKNYLAASVSYQIHPLVNTTITLSMNLDDGSGYILPAMEYSLSDAVTLSAGALIASGNERSEYWYYPSSVYVRGQVYF